ncbi:MAG: Mov34/MPN/PAD-1 family protein [Pseudonocardia sp.]
MLVIRRDLAEAVIAHAREQHPVEACGYIVGPEGSTTPVRHVPLINAAASCEYFEFDSAAVLRLYREMDALGEESVVVYHSHTASEAYPSRSDREFASEPRAHYVIVGTRDPDEHQLRSYRIVDGQVTEEPVRMVE